MKRLVTVLTIAALTTACSPNNSNAEKTEAAPQETTKMSNTLPTSSQYGLWDWDLLNNTIYFSPRWKSMLGYEESEIKNDISEWKRLLHPEDIESAESKVEDFVNKKTDKYESEFRMQHKDGHYINILSQAFAVEDSDGKVIRLVGTHVDITER